MSGGGPCVLVEPSDYVLRNVGDIAMLQIALRRLRALLPSAKIHVLTDDPSGLRALCPSAIAVPGESRRLWLRGGFLTAALRRALPTRLANHLRSCIPRALSERLEHRLRERSEFVRSVKESDLLVVAGMGGLTDYFPEYARGVLKTLELAIRLNRPVALAGQGIGPLDDPALRALASTVLPKVDLIALRERWASAPLLRSLGVEAERIVITGDDAIEIAHELRNGQIGDSLGLNLRCSTYSGIDTSAAEGIGHVVREAAEMFGAQLIPLPVSSVPGEADAKTLRAIIPGSAETSKIISPADLVREVQRCRLVVTGSYHAGVFALACGIPVIAIVGTTYYEGKFEGLSDMFGLGCEVVHMSSEDHAARLRHAIDRMWERAEFVRPDLLAAAEQQMAWSQAAYSKIVELV